MHQLGHTMMRSSGVPENGVNQKREETNDNSSYTAGGGREPVVSDPQDVSGRRSSARSNEHSNRTEERSGRRSFESEGYSGFRNGAGNDLGPLGEDRVSDSGSAQRISNTTEEVSAGRNCCGRNCRYNAP